MWIIRKLMLICGIIWCGTVLLAFLSNMFRVVRIDLFYNFGTYAMFPLMFPGMLLIYFSTPKNQRRS